jgi:hypothetical protein
LVYCGTVVFSISIKNTRLLLLIQFLQVLLLSEMSVKSNEFLSEFSNHFNFI